MRWILGVVATVLTLGFASPLWAGDWPVYRHDPNRSGATPEQLPAKDLKPAWVFQSPIAPQPAWDAPARWDAYRKQGGIPFTRNYDAAFQSIVVGQRLYFGSSADDSIHCINTQTGETPTDAATGDGPIDAAFMCILRLTGVDAVLREYDLRALTGGRDAQGEVHLELVANDRSYRGRGRSTDIIEASALAFLSAVNRAIAGSKKPDREAANGDV